MNEQRATLPTIRRHLWAEGILLNDVFPLRHDLLAQRSTPFTRVASDSGIGFSASEAVSGIPGTGHAVGIHSPVARAFRVMDLSVSCEALTFSLLLRGSLFSSSVVACLVDTLKMTDPCDCAGGVDPTGQE